MRIGILGSGNIGGTAAKLFVNAGHEVALSHAGGPESLREQVAALGPRARAVTIEKAADFGEVVLLAIPWRSREDLPAGRLRGKIVVDAMNPYRPDFSLYDLGDSTSSEEVAKTLPGARLVKAFNTLYAKDLASRGAPGRPVDERTALLLAGDDADAKAVVAQLVDDIGFAPIDTGSLRDGGRLQQAGGPLYIRVITGAEARAALRRGEEARAAGAPGAGAAHHP
ncbi:NADPH-dependent F420 reductase [Anaeromyxobacter oryzae]|uniref:NADP oxidoreductase n=1 Tax=Anaeromyxobacter oryzae TaxID=2918170 RepID=A0ABM7WTY5_9BACT|nr:NADPH-dependent F420 reductase [Anaeromyxobacter oryzae]BDG02950.1 NADP oxidoreductase [Anaeromyxobacter oryzae]